MLKWTRNGQHSIKSGDWLIIKWPWGNYCLWYKLEFKGRFNSADEAKEKANVAV